MNELSQLKSSAELLEISSNAMYFESMLGAADMLARERFYNSAVDPDADSWPVLLDYKTNKVLFVGFGLLALLGISLFDATDEKIKTQLVVPDAETSTSVLDADGQQQVLGWVEVLHLGNFKYYEVSKK